MAKDYATPPNPHEAEIIANAESYTAFVFGGRFNRSTQVCPTLEDARTAGALMSARIGRPAMIYAVWGARSALVETIRVPARR
jgi:hypothetical protein